MSTLLRSPLTKIICTIGPASSDQATITRLVDAGARVFRLNFSHGELDELSEIVERIRAVASETNISLAIFGDLKGPKIRVGHVPSPGVTLRSGDSVVFCRDAASADASSHPPVLSSTYDRLIDDVQPGERLLVNDGAIRMLIVNKHADQIDCTVTQGGLVTSGKGINLPESKITAPSLSQRDRECVRWSIANELDFLALSFVRSDQEVRDLRSFIEAESVSKHDPDWRMPIISKIELPAAVSNIHAILEASDAIMVARGDLGVEMEIARVPVIQKQLIEEAQRFGKPCIVATQMLESMIHAPSPTRAEASDVANAIFAGVDAVMLSGETAVGQYPVLAVEHMRLIAQNTELFLASQPQEPNPPQHLVDSRYRTAALAHGILTIAIDYGAVAIVIWSQKGGGARVLSQHNVSIPILAMSTDTRALRQMTLLRGVTPVTVEKPHDLGHFTQLANEFVVRCGWAAPGQACVLAGGSSIGVARSTNAIAILEVGNLDSGFGRTAEEFAGHRLSFHS